MPKLHLTLAISDYDHVRDFAEGDIEAEGIEIAFPQRVVWYGDQ